LQTADVPERPGGVAAHHRLIVAEERLAERWHSSFVTTVTERHGDIA
jgi:hypothetical protein